MAIERASRGTSVNPWYIDGAIKIHTPVSKPPPVSSYTCSVSAGSACEKNRRRIVSILARAVLQRAAPDDC